MKVGEELWRLGPLNADETQVALVRATKKDEEIRISPVSELSGAVVEIEFNAPLAAEMQLADRAFEDLEAAATAGKENK